MICTSIDRWTCPQCGRTVAPLVPIDVMPAAIRAARERHAELHSSPLELALRALDDQPNASRAG